jgi:hypothetical protein
MAQSAVHGSLSEGSTSTWQAAPLSRRSLGEKARPPAQQPHDHHSFKGLARGDRNIISAVAKPSSSEREAQAT